MSEAGSGIEGLRHKSAFARYVADRLGEDVFKLVDVGCAGGLARGWREFGDHLAAIGFDTNAEEVARLAAAETNPRVSYAAGWVGMAETHPLRRRIAGKGYWHNWPAGRLAYERTYDVRRARAEARPVRPIDSYYHDELLKQDWSTRPYPGYDLDYARDFEVYPPSPEDAAKALEGGADRIIELPAYLQAAGFYDADFLKLDIDGPDYEVLRSVSDLLTRPSLLGVSLEVSYYGSHDANDNTFHNMDRLMREKGFDLFGLSVRSYASAALPWPYMDKHPSMNSGGRPLQGDALYLRDVASRSNSSLAEGMTEAQLAKTAALFALFTLPDQAAEVLIVHHERLARLMDVEQALDLLALEIQEEPEIADNYRDYVAAFEAEHPKFFDVYTARNDWMTAILGAYHSQAAIEGRAQAAEAEAARLRAALDDERARLQAALAEAQHRAASEAERRAQAEARLSAMETSTSWRVSAPLRGAARLLRR